TGKSGQYKLTFDYNSIETYQADGIEGPLWQNNNGLVPSSTANPFDLSKRREKVGFGFEYNHDIYGAFVKYSQEDKTGTQSSSLVASNLMNFGLPIDSRTQQVNAGVNLSGDNWTTQLSYLGSYYENNINNISFNSYSDNALVTTPDNQAQQVALSGQYQFDRTIMSGRVVAGRMEQNIDFVNVSGVPIQSWDGDIETFDSHFAMTSMLTNRLRLGGSINYSNRDNQSPTAQFLRYRVNNFTGALNQRLPQDITKTTYKINSSYHIASGYRLLAGVDRKEVERSNSDREKTHDDSVWMKLNVNAFDSFNAKVKLQHANRSGSKYQAYQYTLPGNNPLLRKYYLADRSRNAVEFTLGQAPASWVNMDLSTRYAKDDYSHTQIGLKDSIEYAYNMNINLDLSKHINGYVSGGQQWIYSNQGGSQSFTTMDWKTHTEDQFINAGAGVSYSGLMQDKLTLGLDYLFSHSNSDVDVISYTPQTAGDYYSDTHNASAYANYTISPQMAVKLTYRYERYVDTDSAQVGINDIAGMTTLGDINHNYNAHQVMVSFNYKLR
ncbi:MtrB/PioB family decaheme-associated outer membrane protein, partial [Shewanella intestini]